MYHGKYKYEFLMKNMKFGKLGTLISKLTCTLFQCKKSRASDNDVQNCFDQNKIPILFNTCNSFPQ